MSKQYTHLKNYFNCFTADNVTPQRDGTVNYDYSSRNFKIKLHAQKSNDAVKGAEKYLDELVIKLSEQLEKNPSHGNVSIERNDYIESLVERIANAEISLSECKLEFQMYQDLHLEMVGVEFKKWTPPSLDEKVYTSDAIQRGKDIVNRLKITNK